MKLENDKDAIIVFHKLMETHCLSKALMIKEKVDRGESLDNFDIGFIKEVFSTMGENKLAFKHHPECEKLATYMMQLYMEIAEQMIKNRQLTRSGSI